MKTWRGIPREEIPWYPTIDPELCTGCRTCVDFCRNDVLEFDDVLGEIMSHLRPDATLVSLAPKIHLAKLAELAGGSRNVARVIPNAPSIVGEGYNPVACSGNIKPEARKDLISLMRVLGECPEVREDSLEAYAMLTGMGPTYLWFQLVEMKRLAETFGLGGEEAAEATYRMAAGAAKTLRDSGVPPEDVIDLIPVKPLSDDEETIREIYRSRLSPLYRKLKGKGFRVAGIKHDAHRLNDPGAIAEFIASLASGIDRN